MRTYKAMSYAAYFPRLVAYLVLTLVLIVGFATEASAKPLPTPPGVCAPSSLASYVEVAKAEWTSAGYPLGWGSGCSIQFVLGDATLACGRPAAGCAESTPTSCKATIDPRQGDTYTQIVTTHELGHCLGLPHLRSKRALMYGTGPITASSVTDVDSRAIKKLYAKGSETPTPRSETKGKNKPPKTTTTIAEMQECQGPKDPNWQACLLPL